MLEMRNISMRFGSNQVLGNVDLTVESGRIHALCGANGAGKSTLMKVLGGLYPSAEGTISLDGVETRLHTPRQALLAGIGMVYQEFDLVPSLSGAANILLGHNTTRRLVPGLRYFSRGALQRQAERLSARYRFDVPLTRPVEELTVGARQLIQVLKVLAQDSRVVVFDEPTARLTATERAALFAVMRRLAGEGRSVIFISHYLEEVLEISDHVTILRDGRNVFDAPAASVTTAQISLHMVGHEVEKREFSRNTPGGVVLKVDKLSCRPHFSGVDFEVRAGEVVGLTGIVGSGRQQLVRALVGEAKSAGTVSLNGVPVSTRSPQSVVGRGIGFVPEDRRLEGIVPDRSIESNVILGTLSTVSRAGFVDRKEARRRAADVIDVLSVRCTGPGQPVSQLSGGNQQKVLLGRWLEGKSDALVLESPTVGVDVVASDEIHHHIRRLAGQGKAVLVSTDDLEELERIADRILVMVRGRIVAEFPPTVAKDHLIATLGGSDPSSPSQKEHAWPPS
ncbi:sugar ABC transporter ATP-binding protein [Actinomadura madurae]